MTRRLATLASFSIVVLLALLLTWLARFEISSTATGHVFVLDRWSGAIKLCSPDGCLSLQH
jgi:hypothetical protein